MRRLTLILTALLAVAIATLLGSGSFNLQPVGGQLLQDVNLSCNDGTDLDLALDPAAVTQLSDAVTAINLYPAGDPPLACSLSQLTVTNSSTLMGIPLFQTSSASASGSQKDFAVMGGQIDSLQGGCIPGVINIAFSAHADTGTTTSGVGGTYNQSFPPRGANDPPDVCEGHFKAVITCLDTTGTSARMQSIVTHATGQYSALVDLVLTINAEDNTPAPDNIRANFQGGVSTDCSAAGATVGGANNPVVRGNITVKDRTP